MNEYQCYKCNYRWKTRTRKPKACPRCKTRLDYVFKEKIINKKNNGVVIDPNPKPEQKREYEDI